MAKKVGDYNILKRADGRWYVQLMQDGKKVYIYGKTKNEVATKLKSKLKDIEEAAVNGLTNYLEADKYTVLQWANQCLKSYSKNAVRGSTYASYLTIINNYLGTLGERRLSDVSNVMIQDHITFLARKPGKDGLGEKSLINVKNFLSLIFNKAVANNMLLRSPVIDIEIPKCGSKVTRALSEEEQHRLLDAARNYERPIMFAVVFALYTGCRKGEVLGLQWKDVDFDRRCISISKQLTRSYDMTESGENTTVLGLSEPKTDKSVREIYICAKFADEFREFKNRMMKWKREHKMKHSEDDFVFIGEKNKPIEPRVFYKYYQEVMEIAEIDDCNFHTLRHTFATRCIEKGMDILMVSRTLGHSNISTTLNKYSHLLPKHQIACMEKLDEGYY